LVGKLEKAAKRPRKQAIKIKRRKGDLATPTIQRNQSGCPGVIFDKKIKKGRVLHLPLPEGLRDFHLRKKEPANETA